MSVFSPLSIDLKIKKAFYKTNKGRFFWEVFYTFFLTFFASFSTPGNRILSLLYPKESMNNDF